MLNFTLLKKTYYFTVVISLNSAINGIATVSKQKNSYSTSARSSRISCSSSSKQNGAPYTTTINVERHATRRSIEANKQTNKGKQKKQTNKANKQSKQKKNNVQMRISLSQEAILSLENDAKTVLRFPENRKWDS